MIWVYVLIFGVSILRTFARAAQQLNVVHYRWLRVPAFSYLMGAGDFAMWGSAYVLFDHHNWPGFLLAVLIYGTAGWIGATVAMYLHQRTT